MNVLLDTHVWIWSVSDPARLSTSVREVVEDGAARLHLSSISFWEVALLVEHGRIALGALDLDAWLAYAGREYPMVELPLTSGIAVASRRIALPNQDPADRFIAATAIVHDLTLLTHDRVLLAAEQVPTLGP